MQAIDLAAERRAAQERQAARDAAARQAVAGRRLKPTEAPVLWTERHDIAAQLARLENSA